MQKRTKILATVGPASHNVEVLAKMIKAGVNVFRLNFSHGTHEYHLEVLTNIRTAISQTKSVVGILQDISGPKIRIGQLAEDFHLHSRDIIDFYRENIEGMCVGPNHYKASINQSNILKLLKVGDNIYMCDGAIKGCVVLLDDDYVRVEILNRGKLSSRKGVNFPNTSLGIDVLTPKDRSDIAWGVDNGVDFMAISFVQNAADMVSARELVTSLGGEVQLFAKIEKFDAVENIDEILAVSDGLMVARGDLGIEVPYYQVPTLQKMLIRKANIASKPVITATQMLLSMTEKESATRAEISDVANAVLDGTDAVMLSEESAVGHNPVLVVETMVNTIRSIEEIYPFDKFDQFVPNDSMDVINESAIRLGDSLNASGIIAMTTSGQSVKKLARYRPKMSIFATAHEEKVARLLTMVWGVASEHLITNGKLEERMCEIITHGLECGFIDKKQTYIFTAGDPVGVKGTTNVIRILREHELNFFGCKELFCTQS